MNLPTDTARQGRSTADGKSRPATPFTILTGFLGAGKTTALNRVLAQPGGKKIAVLVNELGRISIDSKRIIGASGDVIELAGGCLCCKLDMRSDLWGGIVDIIERSQPDHVILETTGIAEPPALIDGLEHFKVKPWVQPAGVVCVIDASQGVQTLANHEEARIQLDCADRVLLSKLDISTEAEIARIHGTTEQINNRAERASFPGTDIGNRALSAWLTRATAMPTRSSVSAANRSQHRHRHRHRPISAASFVADQPLIAEPLVATINRLATQLLRVKGFVHLVDEPRCGVLELASSRVTLSLGDPWGQRKPRTELVLIGEGLNEASIHRQLWACLAQGARSS